MARDFRQELNQTGIGEGCGEGTLGKGSEGPLGGESRGTEVWMRLVG